MQPPCNIELSKRSSNAWLRGFIWFPSIADRMTLNLEKKKKIQRRKKSETKKENGKNLEMTGKKRTGRKKEAEGGNAVIEFNVIRRSLFYLPKWPSYLPRKSQRTQRSGRVFGFAKSLEGSYRWWLRWRRGNSPVLRRAEGGGVAKSLKFGSFIIKRPDLHSFFSSEVETARLRDHYFKMRDGKYMLCKLRNLNKPEVKRLPSPFACTWLVQTSLFTVHLSSFFRFENNERFGFNFNVDFKSFFQTFNLCFDFWIIYSKQVKSRWLKT